MRNLWDESHFTSFVDTLCIDRETPRELAALVYASRLLGAENSLVMHGGGNTSVKSTLTDVIGNSSDVLFIKGSGVDLKDITSQDFTPVRIEPLRKLRAMAEQERGDAGTSLQQFSNREFKHFLYLNLFNLTDHMLSKGLTPSIETLLHAFLPHPYILHTHARALLTLSNQPDGEKLCRDVLGERMGMVPYIRPGIELACSAAAIYREQPDVEGLVLLKHGLVTFGESAREAYDRMIAATSELEERIAGVAATSVPSIELPVDLLPVEQVAPVIRGACAEEKIPSSRDYHTFVLDFRTSREILDYVNSSQLESMSRKGAMTPDFIIRTKNQPLVLPVPDARDPEGFRTAVRQAVDAYKEEYRAYFERQQAASGMDVDMLDPLPRVALVPGLGLFGMGRTIADARVNADIAESSAAAVLDAERIGCFESITEKEVFDIEYWEMEQAKVKKVQHDVFAGKVVLVTGAAGGIGLATARAFRQRGAELVILDLDAGALDKARAELGPDTLAIACDVTDRQAVADAFNRTCRTFGGVDIIVSNVGIALQGRIGDVDDDLLRRSFELNFFSHQTISQHAVSIMRQQGIGGCLLYNVSKQAVNPGPDFGPYGLPKAATLFLVRQYALDHGRDGIRANGINADRIRTGLLNDSMIAERSRKRGLSPEEYMAGNLLKLEVTAEDVAEAFVHQALERKTTGSITTVDGGNIAAALR
ncbi:bifunctional aldolase/short-chain dehydrogenase [Prosthecochloris sp. N3]|uniref:Bifunctional aldolase/short-chain dehydrogenase n=1 Tax=Prosthecochloris ethylica TaxID=2743976 RepID=A0ABR9XU63_9CHLB|nr:bifunctional aldolase/short-chain dehydrogenase [Prosthecochloris ethylica]MBF0587398.1 bifunctional aldolase/short-chain dehydrogenase [Prosthecochloris ethylica]MBF0637602.1 bifunctional aldolase/short-chain dehydrogenase [Prosthecochloris ethylica]NUK48629.1 bifunctional aldolase/short-chain dehydrogenase [Prosthecochloris ethylica]